MERIAKTAIRMLPSRQQEVFLMSRDDGLSHQEIAGILNISKNTVNNLLVKAIKNVRDALKEVGVSILLVLFHNLP